MNFISRYFRRALLTLLLLHFLHSPEISGAASPVVAEMWPAQEQENTASGQRALDAHRKSYTTEGSKTLLENLKIPVRDTPSLVRVRGILIPPQTGGYTIHIHGGDPAELWFADDNTGEWKLIQRSGNPNTGAGRNKLEKGVPKRFEFWTSGRGKMSVQWELATRDEKGAQKLHIPKASIPASCITAWQGREGDVFGSGLKDPWKQKWGLNVGKDDGLNGPWGDPDGDGLLNWQEQIAGTNPLKADAEGQNGLVRWEVWRNVPGRYVFDLTRSEKYPQKPDEIRYLNRLEIPVGNGNDYGSRVRGLIKPPVSGEYTFMVIANDTSELWLGETEAPQSRKLIARVEQSGAQSKWVRFSESIQVPLFGENVSVPIQLEAGRSYYVEVLHKQDYKEDHCSVGWILPGATSPTVIGGDALVSWKSGVPDSSEGINRLTAESWDKMEGNSLFDLVNNKQFPGSPSGVTLVDNLDFSDEGESYAVRLRGYITAPEDGPYVFYISGNDACTLYLADSDDKFRKQEIAQTPRGTGWRAYGRSYSQQSDSIEMRAGQQYYIEVLFKRGPRTEKPGVSHTDHASVAWKRPGRLGLPATVIPAEYFSPYERYSNDADDDDLPDDWEKAHGLDPGDPTSVNGAWGDPDGDSLENLREYQAGLDPKKADVHGAPGIALWECWENVGGNLTGLKANAAYPFNPTLRKWLERFEGPQGFEYSYGSRLRAYLVPRVSGIYTFALSADDQAELWLSESEDRYYKDKISFVNWPTPARSWNTVVGQTSRSVRLEAGKRYYIEALHKQTEGDDHVSVTWRVPGSADFVVIPGWALAGYSFNDPDDVNGNDLPDKWEIEHGYTTDVYNDADVDIDGNGLTLRDEFKYATRAGSKDTDGDGVSDFDEHYFYHSDPLRKDVSPPVRLASLSLANFVTRSGSWIQMGDGSVSSASIRGVVDFAFTLQKPGVYLLEMQAAARSSSIANPVVPIIARLDGVELGRGDIQASGTSLRWLTTWLPAGTHTVSIDNRNFRDGVFLEIASITLDGYEGTDTNGNGAPEWMDDLLARNSRFDSVSTESKVSPMCIEGITSFANDTRIFDTNGEIQTQPGLSGRWFANVPLNPTGDTAVTATYENGSQREDHQFRWVATNLFESPGTIRLRVGDSIKITAIPKTAGENTFVKLTRDDELLSEGSGAEPRIVKFEKAGSFTLKGAAIRGTETLTASVGVEVYAADFGTEFSVASGQSRVWDLPNLPRSLVLETDAGLGFTEMERTPPQSRRFLMKYTGGSTGSPRVLARLWNGGPVVAATTVTAFNMVAVSTVGAQRLIQILPDGTRVIEARFVLNGKVPSDLSIWIHILVADAVFADGGTWHELTAADFNANGEARLRFYKAPGRGPAAICHRVHAFFKDAP